MLLDLENSFIVFVFLFNKCYVEIRVIEILWYFFYGINNFSVDYGEFLFFYLFIN